MDNYQLYWNFMIYLQKFFKIIDYNGLLIDYRTNKVEINLIQ